MSRCDVCLRRLAPPAREPTCSTCRGFNRKAKVNGVIARAHDEGYDVSWSPVNQAYIIIDGPQEMPRMRGVKNNIEGVINFLNDEEDRYA